jgi:hypothetical protein
MNSVTKMRGQDHLQPNPGIYERELDPYALVHRWGPWYVIGGTVVVSLLALDLNWTQPAALRLMDRLRPFRAAHFTEGAA